MTEVEVIERQLDRVLGFFPRVEARVNGLFGVNTLLLALAALNLETSDLLRSFVALPAALFIAGLIASYCFLFKANFPDIDGGKGSVVFFAEIRARSEAGYREAFLEASADEYRDDLIGQIWRNSEILCAKYEGVRKAIYATTATLAPFLVLLTATAALHGRVPLLNG